MNVLSLFDGISSGQIALNRAGIEYDKYFASEVDKYAIQVTQHNFSDTIQLGDVLEVHADSLPKIDLLIGGSPCQGFSFAGKGLNFNDPRSKLFFEFVRLLKETKPRYFMLENVKMKKEYQDVISKYLNVEPIEINSALVSAQNRKRLYWTNIPNIKQPEDKGIMFNKYLYRLGHGYIKDEIKFFKKYPSLAAQSPGTKYRIILDIEKAKTADFEELRKNTELTGVATPEECEEFQTLPIGHTGIVSKTQRYKMIGNGWAVDVVGHIFKNMML